MVVGFFCFCFCDPCFVLFQALTGQQQGSIAQLQSDNFALRQALEESRTQQHQLQVEYEKQLRDLKVRCAN